MFGLFALNNVVVISNPSTKRLLSKLLEDPDELATEPIVNTSETIFAQVGIALQKVVEMVCTSIVTEEGKRFYMAT